jgi:hypothetical protein
MTKTAPWNPSTHGASDDQPKETTKSGIASGSTRTAGHRRRAGTSVRSRSHAVRVPTMAQRNVTSEVSLTVFHRRSTVSGRKTRSATDPRPALVDSMTRKTGGNARTVATRAVAAKSSHGFGDRRLRMVVAGMPER